MAIVLLKTVGYTETRFSLRWRARVAFFCLIWLDKRQLIFSHVSVTLTPFSALQLLLPLLASMSSNSSNADDSTSSEELGVAFSVAREKGRELGASAILLCSRRRPRRKNGKLYRIHVVFSDKEKLDQFWVRLYFLI